MTPSGVTDLAVTVLPRSRRGRHLPALVLPLAAGGVLGVAWHLLAGPAAEFSDDFEAAASADASFFLLAFVAGLLTALVLLARPGSNPSLRLAEVLVASIGASALGVGVAALLGGPRLLAWGGLLAWSLTTAAAVAVVTLVRLLVGSEPSAAPSTDPPA